MSLTSKRWVKITTNVLFAIALAAIFVMNWPTSLGGKATWVMVSGNSMLPNYETGDMVVAWDAGNWEIGDVVLYSVDGTSNNLIVHRLVSGNATDGWYAQGDNKPQPDPWRIPQDHIYGKEIVLIPSMGTALTWVRTPQVLAGVTGFLVFWAILVVPRRKRRLDRVLIEEPALFNGRSATVVDIHTEGTRFLVPFTDKIGSQVDVAVWLNDASGSREIAHGTLSVRYDTSKDGERYVGGPVQWSSERDRALVEQRCSSHVAEAAAAPAMTTSSANH